MGLKKLGFYTLALAAGGAVTMNLLRSKRRIELKDRVVFITGGSRGLGLILAHAFIEEGARVAFCARNPKEIERAIEQLSFGGAKVHGYRCDVSKRDEVEETIRRVEAEVGPIEVLVNNAGVITLGPVETMTVEDFEREMGVHFFGQLYTTLAVLPGMRARKEGRIVNISSIGGRFNSPHLPAYHAAKFASAGLSQSMRVELSKYNIYTTTVFPFLMRVGSFVNADVKGQHKKEWAIGQLMDSLPFTSTTGERTAEAIIKATKWGDATLVPSKRASATILLANIFPNLFQDTMALANRFMPAPDGPESIGTQSKKGYESTSVLAPAVLTAKNDEAAIKNNEL